jgi:hypothetical protein
MSYDALVIAADADDAETQMGGTLAKLSGCGRRILVVDLTDGEPTEFAAPGVRAAQALEAARTRGFEDKSELPPGWRRSRLSRSSSQLEPSWVKPWSATGLDGGRSPAGRSVASSRRLSASGISESSIQLNCIAHQTPQ